MNVTVWMASISKETMDDYVKLATKGSFGILKSSVLHIELVSR